MYESSKNNSNHFYESGEGSVTFISTTLRANNKIKTVDKNAILRWKFEEVVADNDVRNNIAEVAQTLLSKDGIKTINTITVNKISVRPRTLDQM